MGDLVAQQVTHTKSVAHTKSSLTKSHRPYKICSPPRKPVAVPRPAPVASQPAKSGSPCPASSRTAKAPSNDRTSIPYLSSSHATNAASTMEGDHSIKTMQSKGAAVEHSSGGKIPYPKHVWSPAGGWYAQPANWKANTAIMGLVVIGITAIAWNISAERETRDRMPEKGRFYPSRYWSKQIIEHERAVAAKEAAAKGTQ